MEDYLYTWSWKRLGFEIEQDSMYPLFSVGVYVNALGISFEFTFNRVQFVLAFAWG